MVVTLGICEDCTTKEPVVEDGADDEPMPGDVTAERDIHPVGVPVVVAEAETIGEEVPEVPKIVEEVSEVREFVPGTQEVNEDDDLLAAKEPDKTGAGLVAAVEVDAEPPDDKREPVTCCDVELLTDGVAELTPDVGMVPRDREDPGEGTTTTGEAPLDVA